LPHKKEPFEPISEAHLNQLGILYFLIAGPDYLKKLDALAAERNYKNRDQLTISRDTLPNYEEKLKIFYEEHLHEDEEIRYIVSGSGYFDVRDEKDQWVRIQVYSGDLLILPAGIYHRFTLDVNNFLSTIRLFKEEPKWTPINRALPTTESNPFRTSYVSHFLNTQA